MRTIIFYNGWTFRQFLVQPFYCWGQFAHASFCCNPWFPSQDKQKCVWCRECNGYGTSMEECHWANLLHILFGMYDLRWLVCKIVGGIFSLNSKVNDWLRVVLNSYPKPMFKNVLDNDNASIKLVTLCYHRNYCEKHSTTYLFPLASEVKTKSLRARKNIDIDQRTDVETSSVIWTKSSPRDKNSSRAFFREIESGELGCLCIGFSKIAQAKIGARFIKIENLCTVKK